MATHPISPPVDAGDYASVLAAIDPDGGATGVILIGHPGGDGSYDAEFRPCAGSLYQGWKARFDSDRKCTEVISGEPDDAAAAGPLFGAAHLDGYSDVPWAIRDGKTYTMTRDVSLTALRFGRGVTLVTRQWRVLGLESPAEPAAEITLTASLDGWTIGRP